MQRYAEQYSKNGYGQYLMQVLNEQVF